MYLPDQSLMHQQQQQAAVACAQGFVIEIPVVGGEGRTAGACAEGLLKCRAPAQSDA
jgi:hypothetical protein